MRTAARAFLPAASGVTGRAVNVASIDTNGAAIVTTSVATAESLLESVSGIDVGVVTTVPISRYEPSGTDGNAGILMLKFLALPGLILTFFVSSLTWVSEPSSVESEETNSRR